MSTENKGFSIYIIGVIIVTILLLLNMLTEDKLSFDLSAPDGAMEGCIPYQPYLSLPKGDYTFEANSEGTFTVSNLDGAEFGAGEGKIDVKLVRDESTLIVKGELGSNPRVTIKKGSAIFSDTLFVSLLIAVFLIYLGYVHYKKHAELTKSAIYVALIAIAVYASYPLFTDYVSHGQDLNFHLYRIEGIKDGLLSGQFPVRIDPTHNNGYGYITASVYPGLFLYFPALLRLCGVSLPTAYNLFLFAVNLATAFIMYGCTKEMTKSGFAGLFAAVVYTLSTWRMENMLFRAAIGETLAMTFFPVVVLGLYCICKGDSSKWWILTLGCSAVFHSHVISCIFVAILGIVMLVAFAKDLRKEKRYLALIKAVVLTVLLNLWYLLPFIDYYFGVDLVIRHTPENREYFDNSIFPAEMFNFFNDQFGYSQLLPLGIKGSMSLSLGTGVTFCFVIAVLYFVFRRENKIKDEDFHKVLFLLAAFILFMSSTLFPSELFQKFRLFNAFAGIVRMPWRFLSLASPIICIVSAAAAERYVKGYRQKGVLIGVSCLICAITFSVFGTEYTTSFDPLVKKGLSAPKGYSAGWDNEYFIFGTNKDLLEPERYTASGSSVAIISYEKQGTNITVELEGVSNGDSIEVPLLYYPGYSAINSAGENLEIVQGENNVLRVNLTEGTKSVKIHYAGLISSKIGCVLSLLTIVSIALFCIYHRKDKQKMPEKGNCFGPREHRCPQP